MYVLRICAALVSKMDMILGFLMILFSLPSLYCYFRTGFNNPDQGQIVLFGIIIIPCFGLILFVGGGKLMYDLCKLSKTKWTFYFLKVILTTTVLIFAFWIVPFYIFSDYEARLEFLINEQEIKSPSKSFQISNSKGNANSTQKYEDPPSHPAYQRILIFGYGTTMESKSFEIMTPSRYNQFFVFQFLFLNYTTIGFMVYQIISTIVTFLFVKSIQMNANARSKGELPMSYQMSESESYDDETENFPPTIPEMKDLRLQLRPEDQSMDVWKPKRSA